MHDFVKEEIKPHAEEYDEKAEMNWNAIRKMGQMGILGMRVPEKYGGADIDSIGVTVTLAKKNLAKIIFARLSRRLWYRTSFTVYQGTTYKCSTKLHKIQQPVILKSNRRT